MGRRPASRRPRRGRAGPRSSSVARAAFLRRRTPIRRPVRSAQPPARSLDPWSRHHPRVRSWPPARWQPRRPGPPPRRSRPARRDHAPLCRWWSCLSPLNCALSTLSVEHQGPRTVFCPLHRCDHRGWADGWPPPAGNGIGVRPSRPHPELQDLLPPRHVTSWSATFGPTRGGLAAHPWPLSTGRPMLCRNHAPRPVRSTPADPHPLGLAGATSG